MQTYTGLKFYPMDPHPEDISSLDIAHSLSLLCRYNGHVQRFMSVAEHCVLMSEAVSPENALWALLHDATEAYVGDMVKPLKRSMPEYVAVENKVMECIAQHYGLGSSMPAEVKEADLRILINEREALLTPTSFLWEATVGLEPLPVTVEGWAPREAEERYLTRLTELLG